MYFFWVHLELYLKIVGWHHPLNGHGFGWTPGAGNGQGGLACCSSWGCKESDTTEWLNWTENSISYIPDGLTDTWILLHPFGDGKHQLTRYGPVVTDDLSIHLLMHWSLWSLSTWGFSILEKNAKLKDLFTVYEYFSYILHYKSIFIRDRKVAVNPMSENVTSHPVFWVNILEDFSTTLLTPACDAVSWCGGCLVSVVALAPSTPRTPKGWSLGCSLPWAPVDSLREVCACFPLVRLRNPESKQKCLGLKCVDSIVTAHSPSETRIVVLPAEECRLRELLTDFSSFCCQWLRQHI